MTPLADFMLLQEELITAFSWFIRWWLILFAVAGVFAAVIVSVFVSTRWMIDKS